MWNEKWVFIQSVCKVFIEKIMWMPGELKIPREVYWVCWRRWSQTWTHSILNRSRELNILSFSQFPWGALSQMFYYKDLSTNVLANNAVQYVEVLFQLRAILVVPSFQQSVKQEHHLLSGEGIKDLVILFWRSIWAKFLDLEQYVFLNRHLKQLIPSFLTWQFVGACCGLVGRCISKSNPMVILLKGLQETHFLSYLLFT